jgi:hypothetical protein
MSKHQRLQVEFYRLSETDPRYGQTGFVIPFEAWKKIPYTDKSLYEKIDSEGSDYPYKAEVDVNGMKNLYYLSDYEELATFFQNLQKISGDEAFKREIVMPRLSRSLSCRYLTLTITYRPQWESY